jgi:hypothetical protein
MVCDGPNKLPIPIRCVDQFRSGRLLAMVPVLTLAVAEMEGSPRWPYLLIVVLTYHGRLHSSAYQAHTLYYLTAGIGAPLTPMGNLAAGIRK